MPVSGETPNQQALLALLAAAQLMVSPVMPPFGIVRLGPQHYLPAEAGTLSRRLRSHF
jgi:hypothetical protein